MTVKFFSLFFINDYGLTPAMISTVTIFYGLCIALCMNSAKSVGQRIGRTEASVLYQTIGVALLFGLIHVRRLPLVLLFHFLRGAFQNGISPLDRAIVADYVMSKHRGKYNAIESLSSVTWCGSAVVGGVLADKWDYR
eukprot:GHVU01060493.1.p1 GENE.GHVU01060493.1~~GHVU01060493.1.p1  ORF type:complete len:138 (-),score=20.28 GHVU01060493.1:882-1295(-)